MRDLRDDVVVVEVAALRTLLAMALRALPYRVWRGLLIQALHGTEPRLRAQPDRIARAVAALGRSDRFTPFGRCLERSLAGWLLLRGQVRCRVLLAAGSKTGGGLFAHASLEVDGQAIARESTGALARLGAEKWSA